MEKFRKLGISDHVLRSIQDEKFEEPTEIQEKTIPLILSGKDVIAGAATGSGKTLAFASGIIHNLEHGNGIQSLIMTPTRELALQVSKELRKFSKYKSLSVESVYGGVGIGPQIDGLRKADIVVGTPGRILDHLSRSTIRLGNVKVLVLDEADRMLDMGFKDDVEKIIHHCPKHRQTLLFSATISSDISQLAHRYMINPVKISAESYVDPSKLEQIYYDVPENSLKFSLLVHLLKNEKAGLIMVFCNTQRNTDFISNNLRAAGITALAIHGGYSQQKRSKAMDEFNSGEKAILICTDVAARGLDIKGVSHVYNYDIPKDSKDYIHRIGRTARAGEEGKAISLLVQKDYDNFQRIVMNDALTIKKIAMPYIEKISLQYADNRTRYSGRGFGNRDRYHRGHRSYGHEGRSQGGYGGHSRYGSRDHRERGENESRGYSSRGSYGRRPQSRFSGSRSSRRY